MTSIASVQMLSTPQRSSSAARELWQGMTPPLLSSFDVDALEAAQEAVPELCMPATRQRPAVV